MRKNTNQKIMFQKEEVISEYITFLSKSPAPVYEPEPEKIDIESPDLIEELSRQLEDNMNLKEDSTSTEDQKEMDERANPKYWVKHMDYDLDELMSEL